MSTILRVIKFALQHFFRNFWLSLVTVSMLTLTLLTVDILLTLNLAAGAAVDSVENRVDITATFKIGTKEEEVQSAATYLRSFDEVRDVLIVDPEKALAEFKTQHANDPLVLSSLAEINGNPFGYEMIIRAKSTESYPMLLEALDHPSFRDQIEEKDYANHETTLAKLAGISDKIRWFGFGLAGIFLLIAILIVFNTVRVTIFVHREEIAIMRLVGATGRFVRWPYILEAIIFSALATGLSALIILPAIGALNPLFNSYFGAASRLSDFFIGQAVWVFGLEFTAAAVVCIISTAFAMRKYLKI
ncbi:MAG: permease-like cell division protein FtsX [Candidatus Uhrbacteria bacterium]